MKYITAEVRCRVPRAPGKRLHEGLTQASRVEAAQAKEFTTCVFSRKSYWQVYSWKLHWFLVFTRQEEREERQRRLKKTDVKRRLSNEERHENEDKKFQKKRLKKVNNKEKAKCKGAEKDSPEGNWFLSEFSLKLSPGKIQNFFNHRRLILASGVLPQ